MENTTCPITGEKTNRGLNFSTDYYVYNLTNLFVSYEIFRDMLEDNTKIDIEEKTKLKYLLKKGEFSELDDIDSSKHFNLLMMEAEKIAATELTSNKLCVISAVGTREYYRKLGYKINGPYMAKELW